MKKGNDLSIQELMIEFQKIIYQIYMFYIQRGAIEAEKQIETDSLEKKDQLHEATLSFFQLHFQQAKSEIEKSLKEGEQEIIELIKNKVEDFFKGFIELGAKKVKQQLMEMDEKLYQENRKTKRCSVVGAKEMTINTIFGPVRYKRRRYKWIDGCGKTREGYLLDQKYGINVVGRMSSMLAQKIKRLHDAGYSYYQVSECLKRENNVDLSRARLQQICACSDAKWKELEISKNDIGENQIADLRKIFW